MSQTAKQENRVVWFEIPVADLDRAAAFYEQLFDEKLKREQMGPDVTLAVFPYEGNGVSGALFAAPGAQPNSDGVRIYLNAAAGLDKLLGRVEAAGGKVVLPPVQLPGDMGRFAHILDTEGNIVGLHQA